MAKNNKFFAVSASAALVASAILPVAASAAYSDESSIGNWAKASVEFVTEQGLMQGENGNFNPKGKFTRAQAAQVIVNYTKLSTEDTTAQFDDVAADEWYYGAVNAAKANGYIDGVGEGNFNPDGNLTRAQAAKIFGSMLGLDPETGDVAVLDQFKDASAIPNWAAGFAAIMVEAKVINGNNGNFNPNADITREELAKILAFAVQADEAGALAEFKDVKDNAELEAAVAELTEAEAAVKAFEEVIAENVEEVKAAIEALNAAIVAVEAFEDETTTEAVTAAKTTVEDAKAAITAFEESLLVAIEEVSAINDAKVKVTLSKDVTEETLEGSKITLTAGEETFTATYKAASLKEGVAEYVLDGEALLKDAVEYTVSSSWTKGEVKFVAKVADQFVASFVKVTAQVPATNTDATNPKDAVIAIAALDQYGEEYSISNANNIEVTGSLNGMPLSGTEITITPAGEITVTPDLKEGDVLTFTVTDKNAKDEVVAKNEFTYTVIKAEDVKVSAITLKADKTSVPSGKTIKFTADVRDQFESPVTETLRWVVNGKTATAEEGKVEGNSFELTTATPGEYKVQVFSTTNSKIVGEKTVTIGAAELTKLDVVAAPADVMENSSAFNNEEQIIGEIKPNEGAALLVENIKFDVTTSTTGLTKEDIKVTAEKVTTGTGKDAKEIIVIKAVTSKAGTYQVTPFVGEEFTAAEGTIKASTQTVKTTVNNEVASISDITFDAKELKVGKEISKEIVFKNKHGEVLNETTGYKNEIKVVSSATDVVATGAIVNGTKEDKTEGKTFVEFTAEKAGATQLTVQSGDVLKTYTLKFADQELSKVTAGSDVSDVVAGDDVKFAKYNELAFLDQDGQKLAEAPTAVEIKVSGKDEDRKDIVVEDAADLVTYVKEEKDAEGEVSYVPATLAEATHLQVSPTAELVEGTYTVTVVATVDEEEIKASFKVEVGAPRAAKTIELTNDVTKVALNGSTTTLITVKDQYGEIFVDEDNQPVVSVNNANVSASELKAVTKADLDKNYKGEDASTVVGYEVVLTGNAKGSSEVIVEVKEADEVLASAKQSITVDSADSLINTVEVKDVELVNNSVETKTELSAVAKDAANNTVNVAAGDFTWTIEGAKDAEGNVLTVNEGKLYNAKNEVVKVGETEVTVTIAQDETTKVSSLVVTPGFTGSVEVKAESKNLKSDTTVITLNGEAAKYVSGLAVATVNGEDEFEGNGTAVETNEAGQIVLTFAGVDQYGKDFAIKGGVTATSGDDAALKVTLGATEEVVTVTIDALTLEGGNVYVKVGKDSLTINVKASAEFTKAYNDAKAAAEAEEAALNAIKAGTATKENIELVTGKTVTAEQVAFVNEFAKANAGYIDAANVTALVAEATKVAAANLTAHASDVVLNKGKENAVTLPTATEGSVKLTTPFANFTTQDIQDAVTNEKGQVWIGTVVTAPEGADSVFYTVNGAADTNRVKTATVDTVDVTGTKGFIQFLPLNAEKAEAKSFTAVYTIAWVDADGKVIKVEAFNFEYAPQA